MSKISDICINHHIAELHGVDSQLLNDKEKLLEKALMVAEELGLTVVNTFAHRFEPHGLSLVLVISQSHMAIHTWPEFGYMHVDLLTCSEDTDLDNLNKILKDHFSPQKISSRRIDY